MEALLVHKKTGESILIPAPSMMWTAVRSSGAGGQNVNKVSSKIELRFNMVSCAVLDEQTKERLQKIAASYLDAQGFIRVTSQKTRDQKRNLEDARQKLARLIERAVNRPKPRIPTKPSRATIENRLQNKKRNSQKKQYRTQKKIVHEE